MKYTLIVVIVAVLLGLAYGATPITSLPYSNAGDTTNSGFFTPPCDVTKQGDLYSFTGTGDFVFAATCTEDGGAADYDSEIYVWVDGAADECVAIADDNCGSQSKATFLAQTGVNYIIFVSGYSENVGTYTVVVASAGSAATPVPITSLPFTTSGDTSTSGYSLTVCDGIKQGDVFSITGSGGYIFASTCADDGGAASYDTKIIVTTTTGDCVAENDDFCDLQSFTSFYAISGQTYYIIITGFSNDVGTYTLVVGNGEPVNAVPVTSLPFVVSGNTEQSAELSSPCSFGQNQGDLFSLIGDGSVYYATTCAELGGEANFDTVLNVWTPGAIDCTTSNDDACGLQSYVSWTTEPGVEYWIQVQGFGGSTGDYTIVIDKGDPGAPTTGASSASISSSGASISGASISGSSDTGTLNKRSVVEKAFKSQVASASTTTTGLVLVALVCAALMM